MSIFEGPEDIETMVGAERHATVHLARAVSADQRLYILHSTECVQAGIDLRECPYSVALDLGIDKALWRFEQDRVVVLTICSDKGDLLPGLAEVYDD